MFIRCVVRFDDPYDNFTMRKQYRMSRKVKTCIINKLNMRVHYEDDAPQLPDDSARKFRRGPLRNILYARYKHQCISHIFSNPAPTKFPPVPLINPH